jgi:hypothetical protein
LICIHCLVSLSLLKEKAKKNRKSVFRLWAGIYRLEIAPSPPPLEEGKYWPLLFGGEQRKSGREKRGLFERKRRKDKT